MLFDLRDLAGRHRGDGVDDGRDVGGRGAAAAADDVHQATFGELPELAGHVFRGVVVFAELVGKAGVGMNADIDSGDMGGVLDMGAQVLGAERAVEADAQGTGVGDRVPEGLRRLPRERAPRGVGDGARNHHRQAHPVVVEILVDGVDGRLAVQGVEDRLDEQNVGPAVDKPGDGFAIGGDQLIEADVAEARVVDVRRDGGGAVGRPENAGHEARLVGRLGLDRIGGGAGDAGALVVELVDQGFGAVIALRDGGRVERVGLDDVRARFQIRGVDVADDIGPAEGEQIVVALQVRGVIGEAFAPVPRLVQGMGLDHRSHGAVEHENAPGQQFLEHGRRFAVLHRAAFSSWPVGSALARTPRTWQMA